ncbi:MAG: hypothetical protein LBR29_00060 [Methylobacteriaceae bacterium]|nr:hypothetical protein [Methylobacteriaceae bacterium]
MNFDEVNHFLRHPEEFPLLGVRPRSEMRFHILYDGQHRGSFSRAVFDHRGMCMLRRLRSQVVSGILPREFSVFGRDFHISAEAVKTIEAELLGVDWCDAGNVNLERQLDQDSISVFITAEHLFHDVLDNSASKPVFQKLRDVSARVDALAEKQTGHPVDFPAPDSA